MYVFMFGAMPKLKDTKYWRPLNNKDVLLEPSASQNKLVNEFNSEYLDVSC